VKLPRPLTKRPTPQMPGLAGFEPCFAAIPTLLHQPVEVVRPLYWWAKDLRDHGDALLDIRFDATQLTAAVTVRLASYRVIKVVRRYDTKPQMPHDLPTLLAEAVWRCGALGWTDHLDTLVDLLRAGGLISAPASVRSGTQQIPGLMSQPDRAVRIAYWSARALLIRGWQLHACGEDLAQYGFIAEIPTEAAGPPMLVVYPGDVADDGTEASALANHLARLSKSQRRVVQRIIAHTPTRQGRVI
jgi:hypothetical protein